MKFNKEIKYKVASAILVISLALIPSEVAYADFWGGDLPLLAQIVANSLQQLAQLRSILGNGKDTLGLLRDVNNGIREAMGIMRTMNSTIHGGIYSQYQNPNDLLNALQNLYGVIPETHESRLEASHDQSVAEAITLHNQAFDYAAQIDPEAERIKDYSRGTSPAGSARLAAQSLGVLIHVSNQILRTNAAMLKIMSENLALQNHHEKMNSAQFQAEYDGLSKSFDSTPSLQVQTQLNHQN